MERKLGDGIARQELNLLLLIDCSGSMEGENIGAVNNAMRDIAAILPEVQEETCDAIIKISVLLFRDGVEWISSEPQSVEAFQWRDVIAGGSTNLSLAYEALSDFLRKRENGGKMPDLGGIAPIVLLMTDGLPTSNDWEEKLGALRKKGWFRAALKYALAIGVDGQEAKRVLTAFTENPETVLQVYTAESLRRVIQVIAVTASKVKSKSIPISASGEMSHNALAQAEIAEKLEEIDQVEW